MNARWGGSTSFPSRGCSIRLGKMKAVQRFSLLSARVYSRLPAPPIYQISD